MVGPMPQDHVPDRWQPGPRLAMVTDDGSIAVREIGDIPADDTAPLTVADGVAANMRFGWPCWAPDGGALLVSGAGHDAEGTPRMEVWRVAHDGSDETAIVFRNDSDSPGPINANPTIAHYMCWSPSGRMAAVVAQSRRGLMLYLVDARRSVPAHALMAGGPLYFAWAADSRGLAIHLGMEVLLFDTRRPQAGDGSGSARVARDAPTFRTPVWTLDGSAFLYTTPNTSGGITLWRSPREGEGRDAVATLPAPCALTRAPQRDRLAAVPLADERGAARTLTVVDLPGGEAREIDVGTVTGAAWAPGGDAIYTFGVHGLEAEVIVERVDVPSGRRRHLARFRPSAEFAALLTFHDQYAQSHSVVSPDGRWLTFAGLAANNGGSERKGLTPQNGCYIVPTDGSAPARRAGAGEVAFFPPPATAEAPPP